MFLISSCEKCKSCSYTLTDDLTGKDIVVSVGEFCGKDLKDIEGKTEKVMYYGIEGEVTYKCEKEKKK